MTFAFGMVNAQSAFVASDRRYSGVGSLSTFLGTKVCRVETEDSHGILTYAGVGAKAYAEPLEVSSWIEGLFTAVKVNHDQAISEIMRAATEQGMADPKYGHSFLFAGFQKGGPVLDVITSDDVVTVVDNTATHRSYRRGPFQHVRLVPLAGRTAFYAIGSGKPHFSNSLVRGARKELRLLRNRPHTRRRIMLRGALAIRAVSSLDRYVSPEAVCVWADHLKTGEHAAFDQTGHAVAGARLPSVAGGMPSNPLIDAILPVTMRWFEEAEKAQREGREAPQFDDAAIRDAISNLTFTRRTKF